MDAKKSRMAKGALFVCAAALFGALMFGSGIRVGAATTEPGSVGDPIITQSYLELRLSELNAGYDCITLAKGETLSLSQGAQVVLYTGSATTKGGLIDLTVGSFATAGSGVSRYHSYLATADGSGFTALTACVLYVSGAAER